jgi:hypothetical protein
MKFEDFIEVFPAAIQENYVNLTPKQLEELVKLLEGLETQLEKTCEELTAWIRKHQDVRDAVINFTNDPDRENVNSPRQKPSSESEILQNLFELRKQAREKNDAQNNLPPTNN